MNARMSFGHRSRSITSPLFRLILASCLVLAASQAASAQETAGSDEQSTEQAEIADHVSVNEATSDSAIEQRISDVFRATEWFEEARVTVRDGVTFLEGSAINAERKDWAGQLARNTEGVVAVVNQLEVKKVSISGAIRIVTNSVRGLVEDFLVQLPLIIAGLIALVLTALVVKLVQAVISRFASRSRLRTSLQDLILQLVTIAVWVAGLLVVAVIMFPGMTPSKALTVLGVGSVAVGFAFKDIFENFFAGVLILWKYPFDRGDFIQCGEIEGRIEEITIRMSMIRQVDGQLVVVPNAVLFKNPVDVLTDQPTRRITVICGVAYASNLDDSAKVIRSAVEGCSSVDQTHPIEVFVQALADSSINFEVCWWAGATPLKVRESRDEVVRAIKRKLDEADIEIPFPQRTLWFPEPVQTIPHEENEGTSS